MRMQGSGAAVPATVANNVRSAVARMAGYEISCLARDPRNPAHVWCLFLSLERGYRCTFPRQISQISMSGVESRFSCRVDDGYGTCPLILLYLQMKTSGSNSVVECQLLSSYLSRQ
jgi:hypothetical protein